MFDQPEAHKSTIREDGLRYWLTVQIERPLEALFDWLDRRPDKRQRELEQLARNEREDWSWDW